MLSAHNKFIAMTQRQKEIKFALYSIKSMHDAVKDGTFTHEKSQDVALRYWNDFNLSKELIYQFFGKHQYVNHEAMEEDDPTPKWVMDDMAQKCWYALEYFKFI